MERARRAATRGLELDPELAITQTAMASVWVHGDWDFARAEAAYRRALDLDPGFAVGHHQYGVLLAYLGRVPEAIEQMEIGRDLDPLTQSGSISLGRLYERAGQPERAVAYWNELQLLAPSFIPTYYVYGDYLCRTGNYEEALPLLRKALAAGELWTLATLGYCQGISGRADEARGRLEELSTLSKSRYVTPMAFALVHTGLGESDAAFDALERAYEIRAPRVLTLQVDPRWDALRGDPRFQDLLRRIGFPES